LAVHESENDINNTKSLLSDEVFENTNSEENPSMEQDGLKEEDILAVATGLSEDLSNIAASVTAEEADVEASTEVVEESAPDAADVQAEETDDVAKEATENVDVESSEESSSATDESEVQNDVDSDNATTEEDAAQHSAETQEEAAQDDLSPAKEGLEQVIEQLNSKVSLLEEENEKLKKALHMTLVERVVDTKISLGLESLDDRDKLITEHRGRTASSLADTLRDLAKVPAAKQAKTGSVPEISTESEVLAEENVVTVGEEVKSEAPAEATAEQLFVDALMGRRKL
jgi:hypothetical protein